MSRPETWHRLTVRRREYDPLPRRWAVIAYRALKRAGHDVSAREVPQPTDRCWRERT